MITDDAPPRRETAGHGAPPLTDTISEKSRRFYAENKRVANALAKGELGWRPKYPSYREGLTAILEAENA